MKDKLGRNFMVGDYICFPIRSGSSMSVRIAKIVALSGGTVLKPIIESVYDTYSKVEWRLCKKAILECPERAIILDKFSVPKSYTDLFNDRSQQL